MSKIVTATNARTNFGQLLQDIVEDNQPRIVERGGKQEVVMLSIEQYNLLLLRAQQNSSWQESLDTIWQLAAKDLQDAAPPDPVELIRAMRQERSQQQEELLDLS